MIYTCMECNLEFESKHKTALCPKCKSIPLKCVVCGKEFEKKYFPYNQKTCSSKCRGIYRKETGIAKAGAAKMKETKIERYGTLDPAEVTKAIKGGQLDKKICPLCGKEFVPNTPRQIYCTDKHYGPCPVCGKKVEIKDISIGPQACSEECRIQRIYATNLKRYGNKDSVNSDHAKQLAKQHSLEKWGVDCYSKTDEYKQRYKKTSLEKYGTEHPMQNTEIKQKAKNTSREKYGYDSYMQTEEGKSRLIAIMNERYGGFPFEKDSMLHEAYQNTMIDRYGVPYATMNEDLKDKQKANNLEKYGTEWAAVSEEANEKRKQTNLQRYGAENVFGSPEIQEKSKRTCIEKYGGPNAMYSPELAKLASERQQNAMIEKYGAHASSLVPEIRAKIEQTNMERYGVPWYGMSDEFATKCISKMNQKFAADLGKMGISSTFEFRIDSRRYDIKIKNSKILIEIDPTYTHNSMKVPKGDPHDKYYHLMKTQLAESNGYNCIHIFDWDNSRAILNLLRTKTTIYARKCKIQQIDKHTASVFTEKYHLQGSCRGQNIVYGLYFGGELVQLMSFGKPRYNKNYDFELLRLCTKFGTEVVGGASRLFSHFIQDHPDSRIISYCDYAKFTGTVYEKLGMKMDRITPPAKVWSKGSKYITDNYLRQRGYDQIFKTNYGKGTSNEQLMLENGWLPVYDCGQKVFIYESNEVN